MPPGPARALGEGASLARLGAAGIPVVLPILVSGPDEAVRAAQRLGLPVVVKLAAPGIAHKSDIGGVRPGLATLEAVRLAATELLALELPDGAEADGLLVAPHLTGVELLIGGRRDASFGPLVLVGLGGVLAEVIDDLSIRLAPIDSDEAATMLDELRGRAVLDGVRGRPGIDREAVIDAVVALSRLLDEDASIIEVDANPLISGPAGTAAVDALVVAVP